MNKYRFLLLGIIACLVIAAGAYFWATGIMDSLYAFRSPLHSNPPAPGEAVGGPLIRRVVFVLIDALRDDTSHKTDVMPFLNQLRKQGAWATNHSRAPSYSAPGYSVLMTGAWPDVSDGPAMNPAGEELPPTWTQDNLFTAAHRAGLKTAVSGYIWFKGLIPQRHSQQYIRMQVQTLTVRCFLEYQITQAILAYKEFIESEGTQRTTTGSQTFHTQYQREVPVRLL